MCVCVKESVTQPFEGTQKDLPTIILDEVHQTQEDKGHRGSVIDGMYKLIKRIPSQKIKT